MNRVLVALRRGFLSIIVRTRAIKNRDDNATEKVVSTDNYAGSNVENNLGTDLDVTGNQDSLSVADNSEVRNLKSDTEDTDNLSSGSGDIVTVDQYADNSNTNVVETTHKNSIRKNINVLASKNVLAFNEKQKQLKEALAKKCEEIAKKAGVSHESMQEWVKIGANNLDAECRKKYESLLAAKNSSRKTVMISYNWTHQELAKALRDELQSKYDDIFVWIDIDCMGTQLQDSMAEAVQTADLIIVCATEEYKQSKNCKKEAIFAEQQQKPIAYLIADDKFQKEGWLGLQMGKALYYPCTTIDAVGSTVSDVFTKYLQTKDNK